MHTNHFKTILKNAARVLAILSFATAAHGQQTINLTAAPTTTAMPDGTVVPMWGYFCGTATGATCAALNPNAGTGWSPVVITVPYAGPGATSLTINLTNNLSFPVNSTTPTATIPTSIVIVGQVGGGLGVLKQLTSTPSPDHSLAQGCPSWFIAANPPGTACTAANSAASGATTNTPPVQGNRVQSLAAEVSAVTPATTASCTAPSTGPVTTGCGALTWTNLRPGTYLLESGTHQSIQVPMGLIGMLVVTTAPSGGTSGTAYPGSGTGTTAIPAVQYNAEVPLEFSEIDPVQNMAVNTAVNTPGFSETRVWSGLPTNPQGEPGCAVPGSTFYNACYPPVVNYTPFYYLINGVAFNKTNAPGSLFAATAGVSGTPPTPVVTGIAGTVLARLVNAGVRMHVPSIVGSQTAGFTGAGVATTAANPVAGFSVIAEDGNPVPGVQVMGAATAPAAPRVQTDVFMAAGKTFDVMINAPAAGSTAPALAIYDRELSLSGNSSVRDAGMVAYIGVNGAGVPVAAGAGPAVARNDTYNGLAPGEVFSVSDPSKGLIANDTNVNGVTLLAPPANGTLSCNARPQNPTPGICANGTFTYTPTGTATSDTFSYCANGSVTGTTCSSGITAMVSLGASNLTGNPSAVSVTLYATASTYIKIQSPGLLAYNNDPNNLPLSVALSGVDLPACTNPVTAFCGSVDPNGGFTASVPSGTSSGNFHYKVQNSQGTSSGATPGTVTVNFPAASGLQVNVVDAQAYSNCQGDATCISKLVPITDYRWIIEEDKTFWVDPNCTTNNSVTTPGCPGVVSGPTGQTTVPTFGTNFHVSHLDYVAQGCTGQQSCEWGQTMLDTRPACSGTLTPPACSTTSGMHIPAVCDLGNGACRPDPGDGTTSGGFTWVNPSAVHLDPSKRYYISVLPGDAANPFPSYAGPPGCNPTTGALPPPDANGVVDCGHTMGGAQIAPACNIFSTTANGGPNPCTSSSTFANTTVTVKVMPTPLATAKLSVFVFEDDFPLNGEQDGGGGVDVVAPVEPGLGDFEIILWDTYGGLGDVTGQDTHDMFNQPLSNSLAGTIDPATGFDACPIAARVTNSVLNGVSVKAALSMGSPTFTLAMVPGDLAAGTSLSDTGNAIPPQTTVVSVAASGTSYIVTMSAAATASVSADTITAKGAQQGITGRIVTCPKYESDNATLSPLAGQAVIANLMADKFSVQAYPAADRIARGEEWLQTNTLDGQHPHDAFVRVGEPGYFQEFGPAGYHVSIGFANPKIINDRAAAVCNGAYGAVGPCTNTIQGQVDVQRLSRTPDQRLYPSGSRDALAWTQCWVSLGDPDAEDFMFTKCDANGNFKFTGVPGGNWRLTIGDQWNDQIIDGLSTPANVGCVPTGTATTCTGGISNLNLGNIGVQQWQSNVYTRLFVDDNKNGIKDPDEIGVPQVYTHVRYRDGHSSNVLLTDPDGVANFNETFPLFNWYVVEPDLGRYKRTGTHTVYDAGGPADGSTSCGTTSNGARQCGSTSTTAPYAFLANTYEAIPLPADLSVPGAVYCATADCSAEAASFAAGTAIPSSAAASTGRIDPPWVNQEGWSGMTSQGNWIEFGVAPYAECNPALPVSATNFCASVPTLVAVTDSNGVTTYNSSTKLVGENGGIHGHTAYASTRPFDDASQMIEQPWQPYIPNVTVNLYQEGFAADGVTPTLTLVDTTVSTSWDAWAQGFYPNSTAGTGTGAGQKPYMSCPGQGTSTGTNADLFYFSLMDQPEYLDWYNNLHNGGTLHTLPYNSQYKCYDSMHIWNQIQPAPYDGFYQFPSITGINPTTGAALGTNCTICVNDPDSSDPYRYSKPGTNGLWNPANGGVPMLPPGKYVVEVVMPRGYEVEKEEDKNLLIGDNYVAPATVQFGGLGGSIFIMPDQASVASMYDPSGAGYNGTNYQNQTTALGTNQQLALPGFPGFQDPIWPCVGEMRVVPDYLSLFPQALETAPFAGATRPLCDRKEVTLGDQTSVSAKFYLFTSAHIAAKFTGVITDDLTAEFDPFSPQFGEKFAPANLPVATKDALGNEISRVYADHWGTYESVTFSSWDVNPPNITGYGPAMMVQCMNDAGPILDTRGAMIPDPNNPGGPLISNPTNGQMITDPLYNPAYSQFCYEEPYMPGLTTYLDTPVVPTQAFVGAAYNNPDCAYPDTTPAIKEVDGDAIGPWVSATGSMTLTITALGDMQVDNSGYSGPSANAAPFNLKKVQRHYGFGTCTLSGNRCTNGATAALLGSTPPGTANVALNITSWSDTQIVATIPNAVLTNPHFPCLIQQQAQYSGSAAFCGQLVITAANGKQSIDTVTVTIGGKPPLHVAASETIQSYIDKAAPGDLIIVDPTCNTTAGPAACTATGIASKVSASHKEMVIMWKPVRLQGVGAASTIIDANTHPAGKLLEPWRRRIDCLFGLAPSGVPYTAATQASDCGGWFGFKATPDNPQIDRLPLEATVGWNANLNANIAELLQEPTLMGAYSGAGITVLAKGLEFHGQAPWNDGTEPGAFPAVTTLLTGVGPNPLTLPVGDANPFCHTGTYNPTTGAFTVKSDPNPYPSNFTCNPSSIDGLTVRNSSQGGGGIFVHGWAHHLQIANNRVTNNAGTLTGGISVGQGEFAGPYLVGSATNPAPGSCSNGSGLLTNQHEPDCFQLDVNLHNNMITNNASLGDELFSATLAGGGGATFCTGNDYYKFNYNWVCGNLSAGEGGGIVHLGEIQNGDIEHNTILLNQSSNPTIPTHGGGIMVQGTPDTDPVCSGVPDSDCPPGLSDGTGRNLVINANLIEGNSADSGSGGGIRLNQVNGTEVSAFPGQPTRWNNVSITNNIINNNMAGWDGAGISLQDALNVSIINNTIAHNDALASSGVLTFSIGTPQASAPPGECHVPTTAASGTATASCPQVAGVASTRNSTLLTTTFTGAAASPTCPAGQTPATGCHTYSNPILANNIIWQNRSFYIGISGAGTGSQNQQKLVSLYDAFTTTPAPAQAATGSCLAASGSSPFPTTSYWDIGVRGDTGPGDHTGGTLTPMNSVLSSGSYSGNNNSTTAPPVVSQYCNGSRVPPECTTANGCGGPNGFGVPPGISDAVTPNPVFNLNPSATVDEGNNWINVSWGPLALTNPANSTGSTTGNYGGGPQLANYNLTTAIDTIPTSVAHPSSDFFGNPRPETGADGHFDPGAIEFAGGGGGGGGCSLTVSPSTLAFGTQSDGGSTAAQAVTLTNGCTTSVSGGTFTFGGGAPQPFARASLLQGGGGSCSAFGPISLGAGASCTINVVFSPSGTESGAFSRTLTIGGFTGATITGSPVTLTGTAQSARGTLTFSAATNGTLSTVFGVRTLTFTIPTPRPASLTSTVTISNTGGGALSITAEALTNAIGTNFALGTTTCSYTTALAPAGTCTFNVTYTVPVTAPTVPRTGMVTVANNGSSAVGGNTPLALSGR